MMGKQHTIDTDELVADALEALRDMEQRSKARRSTSVHTCRCGALVEVPDDMDVDGVDGLCRACDTATGKKVYEALIR